MKLIFYMQINIKLSYKFILLIMLGMARPGQITQNNKFAKSFQHLKEEERNEVSFFADENYSYL